MALDGETDNEVAVSGEGFAGDIDPYLPKGGRQLQYRREVIERCLFETAVHAGNARKAMRALVLWDPDEPWPNPETVYLWVRGRFRNRYAQIATDNVDDLRENLARRATDLATKLSDAESDSIEKVLAGLADANAVEASIILRNLSQSKSMQIDQEGKLRGRGGIVIDHRGLEEITAALVRLGIATPVDGTAEPADAEVVAGKP